VAAWASRTAPATGGRARTRMSLPGREKAMIALAAISGLSTRRFGRAMPEAQPSEAQP